MLAAAVVLLLLSRNKLLVALLELVERVVAVTEV
jgi:hypothetical protein